MSDAILTFNSVDKICSYTGDGGVETMDHYMSKARRWATDFAGTSMPFSRYEAAFVTYDDEYFSAIPPPVRFTTEMLCPDHKRLMMVMTAFTH